MNNLHGICVPLFSLRSSDSSGIGEFFDLIPLIELMSKTGFSILQLLPLNDSGEASSPYSALSAMALNPIFLSLQHLPFLDLVPESKELLEELQRENHLQRFSYSVVQKNKERFLEYYYAFTQDHIEKLSEYQAFSAKEEWLDSYAHFKALKKTNNKKAWWDWESDSASTEDVNFYKALQFLCFSQLEHVKREASLKGVFLKGDIPILINKDSADVWEHKELFSLDLNAGAPPDMYSEEGQCWGFPLYNWPNHEKENYRWWKERLRVAERFFDFYRIDHIIGFFRIWAVPENSSAKDGFFIPQDKSLWVPQGEKLLRMLLFATKMQPIGEDLGVVHPEIRQTMNTLNIPGTKVYRWERRWQEDKSYIPVDAYPKNSMTCVSTHDSESVAEWWEKGGEDVFAFAKYKGWTYYPCLSSEQHFEILKDSHISNSRFHINLLHEYLSLFPELSWKKPSDDRINIPGTISDDNWTYRHKPTVSEFAHHEGLSAILRFLAS